METIYSKIQMSQLAAFQVKAEAGLDLGELLKTQAVAELNYEIDSEVIKLLDENAGEAVPATTFNKNTPVGVSRSQHYETFAEVLENASRIIYDRTQKHAANYAVISSSIKPMLPLMKGWKPASLSKINGPYYAGELNGLKVFVSPALEPGRYFCGFNGNDLATSAAVWAPFMPVTPTQLLGYADGAMSQGFATLYDLKMLNKDLLVAGQVIEANQYIYVGE